MTEFQHLLLDKVNLLAREVVVLQEVARVLLDVVEAVEAAQIRQDRLDALRSFFNSILEAMEQVADRVVLGRKKSRDG